MMYDNSLNNLVKVLINNDNFSTTISRIIKHVLDNMKRTFITSVIIDSWHKVAVITHLIILSIICEQHERMLRSLLNSSCFNNSASSLILDIARLTHCSLSFIFSRESVKSWNVFSILFLMVGNNVWFVLSIADQCWIFTTEKKNLFFTCGTSMVLVSGAEIKT